MVCRPAPEAMHPASTRGEHRALHLALFEESYRREARSESPVTPVGRESKLPYTRGAFGERYRGALGRVDGVGMGEASWGADWWLLSCTVVWCSVFFSCVKTKSVRETFFSLFLSFFTHKKSLSRTPFPLSSRTRFLLLRALF